jgi:hypothetical protein
MWHEITPRLLRCLEYIFFLFLFLIRAGPVAVAFPNRTLSYWSIASYFPVTPGALPDVELLMESQTPVRLQLVSNRKSITH